MLTNLGWAFHEEGASNCGGCHTIGAKEADMVGDQSQHPFLLLRSTPSDVCLTCHATELGAVFAEDVLSPSPEKGGGNFIFLLEENLNDVADQADSVSWISGDAAGHNINATEHGLGTDGTLSHAPGGTFRSDWLSCTSCHDPHGNANFRMLHGSGSIQARLYHFTNAAPEAEGISLEFGSESNGNHTAYKSGMSQWCANCHSDFHNTGYPTILRHPSGKEIGAAIASAYGSYNGTSDPYGGMRATAYLAEVPFEDNSPEHTTSSTMGPTASSRIMCLTCHRAHASSAPDAGRWDFSVTFPADDGRRSGSYALLNPYDKSQRSLCNKCHIKDAKGTGDVLVARGQ